MRLLACWYANDILLKALLLIGASPTRQASVPGARIGRGNHMSPLTKRRNVARRRRVPGSYPVRGLLLEGNDVLCVDVLHRAKANIAHLLATTPISRNKFDACRDRGSVPGLAGAVSRHTGGRQVIVASAVIGEFYRLAL